MASVFDVANFFIDASASQEEDLMTNLKLNKLLYYAQAWSLVRSGKPLFDEPIMAWQLGPVVPAVYHNYKNYGSKRIKPSKDHSYADRFSAEEEELIIDVMLNYGKLTASALVNKTHAVGGPWELTNQSDEISRGLIKSYFDSCDSLPTSSELLSENNVSLIPQRSADGVALIPREYDDDGD